MPTVVRDQLLPNSITPQSPTYSKGSLFLAIVATLVLIALSTFLLRVYTRTRLRRVFGADDCFMLVAVLCTCTVLGIFIYLTQLGLGEHAWAVPQRDVQNIQRWLRFFELAAVAGIGFVKMSIAWFLIQTLNQSKYRHFLYGMIVIITLSTIFWCGTLIFQCIPVEAAWNPRIRGAKCISPMAYRNISLSNKAIDILTDMILIILPIPKILERRMSMRTGTTLIVLFGLGFTACAAAVARIPLTYNMWEDRDPIVDGVWPHICSV